MKRMLLFLLCAVLAIVFAAPAQAKKVFVNEVLGQDQLPDRIVTKVWGMRFTPYNKDAYIDSMIFYTMENNGDTRPRGAEALGAVWNFSYDLSRGDYEVFFVGTASLRRFHLATPRKSDLNNSSLGYARAGALNDTLGNPGVPFPQTIRDWRPGVLVVRVCFPAAEEQSRTRDTLTIVHETKTEHTMETVREIPTYWVRPTVGFAGCWLDPQRIVTPSIGIAAGTHFGAWNVGAYAVEGQDFQPRNRGTACYGVQFGDELGPSVRVGYRSTWTEIRGDGHTTERSEGGEVGIGYGFPGIPDPTGYTGTLTRTIRITNLKPGTYVLRIQMETPNSFKPGESQTVVWPGSLMVCQRK